MPSVHSPPRHAAAPLSTVDTAALLQGPAGIALHLHGRDGRMTQVPLTLSALREIAALASATLAGQGPREEGLTG